MSKLRKKIKELIKEQLYPDTAGGPIKRTGQRGDEVTGPVIDDFGVCPCGDGTFTAECCYSVSIDPIKDKGVPVFATPPVADPVIWRIVTRTPSDLTTAQNFPQVDCP